MRQIKTSQPKKKQERKTGGLSKVIKEKISQLEEKQEKNTGGKNGQQIPTSGNHMEVMTWQISGSLLHNLTSKIQSYQSKQKKSVDLPVKY